jgi:hypothetical protein
MRAAVGREVDAVIASDQPADASSFESEQVRSRLRWPCRFQYKQDMEAIGREVMASRLPELLAKGLSEAFSSRNPTNPAEREPEASRVSCRSFLS